MLSVARSLAVRTLRTSAVRPALFEHMNPYSPTDEHQQLRDMVSAFARDQVDPQAGAFDDAGELNLPLLRQTGELGLIGLTVPEADGGAGMDAVASCIVHEELSKYDPGFCLAYLAHSLLCVNNLSASASEEQKAKYLPKLLTAESVGCMGMTEPGAGTDVLGMGTTALRKGDTYVLNGQKTYITNGDLADVLYLYAKVDGRVSAFIVEKGTEGFTASPKIDKIGMRASTMATLTFDNCVIPAANLVGAEGQGVSHMMRNLEIERLALAAMSLGIASRSLDLMLDYANQREAFGKPIINHGQIQRLIAETYAETEAARALVYMVAQHVDKGTQNRIGSDAVKLFAAPVGKRASDAAIQVAGGLGYCRGYAAERLWRDAKLLEIGGGTLEAHQKNLAKDLVNWTQKQGKPVGDAYMGVSR